MVVPCLKKLYLYNDYKKLKAKLKKTITKGRVLYYTLLDLNLSLLLLFLGYPLTLLLLNLNLNNLLS